MLASRRTGNPADRGACVWGQHDGLRGRAAGDRSGRPNARAIVNLLWVFSVLGIAVLVPIAVLLAVIPRRSLSDRRPLFTDPARKPRGRIIAACVALTAATVTVLALVSFAEQTRIFAASDTRTCCA